MPNRIIREGINSSPRINALSMGAEVFYRRLMSVVDDFGRYHGSVVTLRGACWPTNPERIREKDVAKWLNELLSGDDPLVKTYADGGATYLEIQDFGQQTRTKSRFPDPPWLQIDSKLPANGNQSADNPLENASTRRSRISKTKTKTNGECLGFPSPADAEFERELDAVSTRIAERHPKHRTCGKGQVRKKLRTIIQKSPKSERITSLHAIDKRHERWCEYWARDPGSPYAKGLANWLAPTEGRFEDEPPVFFDLQEPQPVRRML